MKKINVIGTSGSGKSTFAKALAHKLQCPYIEMDSIHWQNDWQGLADEPFFTALKTQLNQPRWVLDGNYTRTIPIKWQAVDTVIWLHFPFPLVLCRAIKRAIARMVTREPLWQTNNVETLGKLLSKESIVWWTIKTYPKNETNIRQLMTDPQFSHIKFIEITSPKQAKAWLDNLA